MFYGGTTRDYLYWLKRQFISAGSRVEAEKKIRELRKEKIIDVRSFIIGDSDVDVVSTKKLSLAPATYGIRKFDSISPDIFDPTTEAGRNELWQGYAPAEKVRLGSGGLSQLHSLGGAHEIYTGKLSVHFADSVKFKETKYAKAGENHPILLALRYLRLQAINYYNSHGKAYPNKKLLMNSFDQKSLEEVRKIIASTMDGKELSPFLKNSRFKSWLNGTIHKSFRSYTNPTAALELMKMFQVDELGKIYGQENVDSVYNYVFSKFRDEKEISAKWKEFGVTERFFQSPTEFFPDGYLYHGTKEEAHFRSILLQGILPSEGGAAGAGLYGVAEPNKSFAEEWGQDPGRLVKFPVKSDAKIVDIDQGEGKEIWRKFLKKNPRGNYEIFADWFGIDILKYHYTPEAYVVKNSDVLGRGIGVHRQILSLEDLLLKTKDEIDPEKLLSLMELNQISSREANLILEESPIPKAQLMNAIWIRLTNDTEKTAQLFLQTDFWSNHENLVSSKEINKVIEEFIYASPKKAEDLFGKTKAWENNLEKYKFMLAFELRDENGSVTEQYFRKLLNGELGAREPWIDLLSRIRNLEGKKWLRLHIAKNYGQTNSASKESFLLDLMKENFVNILAGNGDYNRRLTEVLLDKLLKGALGDVTPWLTKVREMQYFGGLNHIVRYFYEHYSTLSSSGSEIELGVLEQLLKAVTENKMHPEYDHPGSVISELLKTGLAKPGALGHALSVFSAPGDFTTLWNYFLFEYLETKKDQKRSEAEWTFLGEIIGAVWKNQNIREHLRNERFAVRLLNFIGSSPYPAVKEKFKSDAQASILYHDALDSFVRKFCSPANEDCRPYLTEIFRTYDLRTYTDGFHFLVDGWTKSPEQKQILAAYLNSALRDMRRKADDFSKTKAGDLGAEPLIAPENTDWHKDVNFLRKAYKLSHDYASARSENSPLYNHVRSVLIPLLLENDLWEKAPDLLNDCLKYEQWLSRDPSANFVSQTLLKILSNPKLVDHEELFLQVVNNLDANSWDHLVVPLSKPEAIRHPLLIRNLMKEVSSLEGLSYKEESVKKMRKSVLEILKNSGWKDHPELIEELSTYVEKWGLKNEMDELLALPHWQKHPAFQSLKQWGKIAFWRLKNQALVRFPDPVVKRAESVGILSHCLSFFGRH